MGRDFRPVAADLHLAPAAGPILGGVQKQPTASLATLEALAIITAEQLGGGPSWREEPTNHRTGIADPSPPVPAHRRDDTACLTGAMQDPVELLKIGLVRSATHRLLDQHTLEHGAEPSDLATHRRGL